MFSLKRSSQTLVKAATESLVRSIWE